MEHHAASPAVHQPGVAWAGRSSLERDNGTRGSSKSCTLRADNLTSALLDNRPLTRPTLHVWGWLTVERRYFLYALFVQALVIATLIMAVSSPKLLDTLTTEKTVRGAEVEGPVDRASGYLLFAGALLSGTVVVSTYRRHRRLDWFWIGYGTILLVAALEESDWLKHAGLSIKVLGYRVSALHDTLTKVVAPLRAGTSDYPFETTHVLLALAAVSGALTLLLWRFVPRIRHLDLGMVVLIGLGLFFGSLGTLIDADLLPKPAAIDWKAHLEEPLEAVGAVCLMLVGLEGIVRALRDRTAARAASPDEQSVLHGTMASRPPA